MVAIVAVERSKKSIVLFGGLSQIESESGAVLKRVDWFYSQSLVQVVAERCLNRKEVEFVNSVKREGASCSKEFQYVFVEK
jgi:hypothetical protein